MLLVSSYWLVSVYYLMRSQAALATCHATQHGPHYAHKPVIIGRSTAQCMECAWVTAVWTANARW